jgi:hypothetical protein
MQKTERWSERRKRRMKVEDEGGLKVEDGR